MDNESIFEISISSCNIAVTRGGQCGADSSIFSHSGVCVIPPLELRVATTHVVGVSLFLLLPRLVILKNINGCISMRLSIQLKYAVSVSD